MSEDTNSVGQPAPSDGGGIELRVRRIQEKLQLLLRQRDGLLKENGRLKEELSQLHREQGDQIQKLDQLQQQVEILKVTKTVMSEEEKRGLEKKLGQYIREIDRCITMLGDV
jgi:septal ring factor EnvC (AmiA/AmiB activator)